MNDQWLIFPIVRNIIARMARLAADTAVAVPGLMAIAMLLMLLLPDSAAMLPGTCYLAAELCFYLHMALLFITVLWCHEVLLAERGSALTRYLLILGSLFGVIQLVCQLYTLLTSELLLPRQGELSLILWVLLFSSIVINIGNMAAAPAKWKAGIFATLFLLLIIVITTDCYGAIMLLNFLAKILYAIPGCWLLRKLSRVAPHIISLPEK